MNRVFKCISAFVLSAVLLAAAAVPAFAATAASTGDTIEVRVSVEGEDSMGSTTIQIDYDKDKLDFLSDQTLEGTGLSNAKEAGVLLWADMFDPEGADYSAKTDVYSVIFVAKQDIADVDSIIKFTVKDVYRIGSSGVTPGNTSCLTHTVSLEGTTPASASSVTESRNESSTVSSKAQTSSQNNTSKQTNSTASNNTSSKETAQTSSKTSSAVSSKANNTSSAVSSKADTDEKSKSSSKSESKAEDTALDAESEKSTDSAAESTVSLAETFDEADFESVPPIKLDSDSTSSIADSRGSFPKGVIIGIVACLVIAAAGITVIVAKKKN